MDWQYWSSMLPRNGRCGSNRKTMRKIRLCRSVGNYAEDATMDPLWAPWRLSYGASPRRPVEGDPCFICQGLAEDNDRRNLIALRTPRSVVVLNRFPYNNGHLLVAPRLHRGQFEELDADEVLEKMESLGLMVRTLDSLMRPAGRPLVL